MRKIVFALVLCVVSLSAIGEETSKVFIKAIDVWNDSMIVTFSPEYNNNQSCSNTNKTAFILRNVGSNENKVLVSTIIAATASQNEVKSRLNGCGSGNYDFRKLERVKVIF